MSDLTVKEVDLFGDTVIAAQDKNGVIWAGVRWICNGLGLLEGQIKYERKKIQEDMVLCQGTKFHPLGRGNSDSEVLCLQLDYIPLWLAKISITPKMKENNPELVEKLIKYQLNAKDVLAEAFLPEGYNKSNNISNEQHSAECENQGNTTDTQSSGVLNTLNFHGLPVITSFELAKHYGVPRQNILNAFYRYEKYFNKGIHYFLVEADEEVEFRKINGLSSTKLYLWTRKGSLMFTKVVHNEIGWEQYKTLLDILFQKTYDDKSSNKDIEAENIKKPLMTTHEKQLKPQSNWFLKNSYKIERICKALDIGVKEFNRMVILKIQEKYDMELISKLYKDKNGNAPEYALDIVNQFPELGEIADDVLYEFIFSIIDKFSLIKDK